MMSTTLQLCDGTECHARVAGTGETVVLFHGVGMQSIAWEPQIEALSASFRVVAVDMPGHGLTPPLAGSPRLPDYVAWAAQVLKAASEGPVSIAGHSMGALIVSGLSVEHPELVKRAALLNGVYKRSEAQKSAVLKRADEIAVGAGDINGPLSRWFTEADAGPRARVAQWLNEVSEKGYAAAYRAFAEGDAVYADRLSEVSCPLLVLTGADDPNSTAAMTHEIASIVSNAEAMVIEDHRHMVNLTAPEKVNDALTRWLTKQECDA